MNFQLHPNLLEKKLIIDLPLCRVLLENEKNYPWIFLVPRRNNVKKILDLSNQDQNILWQEMIYAQKVISDIFSPFQLNVAAIGNKTQQLHIHIIGRYESDPAWPNTVWDHALRAKYSEEELENVCEKLKAEFGKNSSSRAKILFS